MKKFKNVLKIIESMPDRIKCVLKAKDGGGGGATQPLSRDGDIEELHEDPTVGPCPKVWTRGQKWK